MTCCLAWNIGLFPDYLERKTQIDNIWEMHDSDARESPSEAEQEFKKVLAKLVARKRDIFPWLTGQILMAELAQKNGGDVLCVQTNGCFEEVALVVQPDSAELPDMIETLHRMHRETSAQVDFVHQVKSLDGVFSDIDTTQIATAYCARRADLIRYRRILSEWRQTQAKPIDAIVVNEWLTMLNQIEQDSKDLLAVIVDWPPSRHHA